MHKRKNPFESTALLLQGGGALGAYQGGVYQALHEAGLEPDWVAGISIGAFNAAIIAGNPPHERLAKLRDFWETITTDNFAFYPPAVKHMVTRNPAPHKLLDIMSGFHSILMGTHDFFKPRPLIPWLAPRGSLDAISFCDTSPLKATLERLIDFDRINNDGMRFNVGAVQVESGNFTTFCTHSHTITVDHIMASGALPPGLPPVKIDGSYYWDGGTVSNTPLIWLLNNERFKNTLVFQVDLWSAHGKFPEDMLEVFSRQKDIRYSSRTRTITEWFQQQHELRRTIADLLDVLPDSVKKSPQAKRLADHAGKELYNLVHLIYHNQDHEGYSKDAEFSRLNMEIHWKSGYDDTIKTLDQPQVLELPHNEKGIRIFDFCTVKRSKKPALGKKTSLGKKVA